MGVAGGGITLGGGTAAAAGCRCGGGITLGAITLSGAGTSCNGGGVGASTGGGVGGNGGFGGGIPALCAQTSGGTIGMRCCTTGSMVTAAAMNEMILHGSI